jgi:imidazoleglycerol-phosphate dehydratase
MRQVDVTRNTSETQIQIVLNLDGTGKAELASGVPFLDHMLEFVQLHGGDVILNSSSTHSNYTDAGATLQEEHQAANIGDD